MSSAEIPQFLRKDPTERVTERKWEVLRCVANGMQTQQIAEHLGITYHTVEGHLEQICAGATLYSGARRCAVLTPLMVEGVETDRIVVDGIPDNLKFSRRQQEVIGLMLNGHRVPGVADALGIAPSSVDLHFTNIYKKLRAKNYYHAVAKMVSYRLSVGQLNQEPDPCPQLIEASR